MSIAVKSAKYLCFAHEFEAFVELSAVRVHAESASKKGLVLFSGLAFSSVGSMNGQFSNYRHFLFLSVVITPRLHTIYLSL